MGSHYRFALWLSFRSTLRWTIAASPLIFKKLSEDGQSVRKKSSTSLGDVYVFDRNTACHFRRPSCQRRLRPRMRRLPRNGWLRWAPRNGLPWLRML